jgi:peptidoglycan hydrolase CwlO-like protein
MDSTLWWIVGILVVLVIIGVIVWAATKDRRLDAQRTKAEQLRAEARDQERDLREREGRAEELQARAEQARAEAERRSAEADQRAAEAKRLQAEAERRAQGVSELRNEHEERMRAADARDPDVPTDKEGYRVDEQGERLRDDSGSRRGEYRRE